MIYINLAMQKNKKSNRLERFLEDAGFQCLMTCIGAIIILIFLGFILYSFNVPMKPFYYTFGALFLIAFAWGLMNMIRKLRDFKNPADLDHLPQSN